VARVGYSARAMRRLAPIVLVAAALGFAACGGDGNNDSASNSTATTQSTTTQSTTGATTGATGKQSGKKKSSANKGSGSGGSGSGGGSTKTQTQTQTQTQPAQTGTTPAPTVAVPFKTAKTVCGTFLPETIQRQIKRGKTTKKSVAKQYSKGFPKDQRNQAYKGCLAGLNKKK
jgi:hypothetical protein